MGADSGGEQTRAGDTRAAPARHATPSPLPGSPGGPYEGEASASPEEHDASYRETFARAPIGLAHVALDGRWLRFNRRLAEIVGYPMEELARLRFQDITHPADLAPGAHHVERLLAGEADAYQLEKRHIQKDGSLVWTSAGAPGWALWRGSSR